MISSAIPKANKKKIIKRYLAISAVFTFLLIVWLTFSPFGIVKIFLIRQEIKKQDELINSKKEEISRLRYQVEGIKNPQLRDEILREELGWVKNNELIYIFPEQKK